MGDKDDGLGAELGLSLSLGFASSNKPPPSSQCMQHHQNKKNSWNDLFLSCGANRATATTMVAYCEEENGGSSPNSTVSSISGKKSENEAETRGSDDEDGGGSRKKLRLSKEQSLLLEETFKEHSTLNPKQKLALANKLNLRPRQVEVWFQNRRARTKLKQTEVDCDYLKRCCEKLTEENRRLHKEVQQLRALKFSPQLYMGINPPTTLTMCPSCERVSSSSPAAARQPVTPCPPLPINPRPAA